MVNQLNRLDVISRPNTGQVSRTWALVTPDDMPPVTPSDIGNVGPRCIGLYSSMDGFVRFITRGDQFQHVAGSHHDVDWLASTSPVQLEIAGVVHRVQWLPSVPISVRVFAPAGVYLWGDIAHVLAHDTTVPVGNLHALGT